MFPSQRFKPLFLYLKSLTRTHLQTPKPKNPFPLILSLKHTSTTSQQHSFTVSYLVNNCGFSPETALKASKFTQFETADKPDSVIAFFRDNGFSNTQINNIVRRAPNVLTCDPHNRVFRKFEFLFSKGASHSYIVELVNKSPRILYSSLENNIIPSYELVRKFLQTDEKTMECILACGHFFGTDRVVQNVKLLVDDGVTDTVIAFLFRRRLSIVLSSGLKRTLDEVKEMGFDPSKLKFAIALLAKKTIPKSRWDAKVDVLKSWGWSEELVLSVFKRQPLIMLVSQDKIDRIMRFWVKQLGWDYLTLAKKPEIFGFSLERRIIPRALVVQYLLGKGLRRKSASLLSPFCVSEKEFIEKYVMRFKEETSELLTLYQMNVQGKKEDNQMVDV
ncbi:unnamed protein product [Sphenostylis stenocarpa]|uniref:Uncharacterized protein n=1 Tax=Sphenostylis stenocarpa TaxID=92480 RepID=A0AA86T1T6_9FABA|nr:unnamed protein product [Sphenostylis stenocarpa]